MESFPVNILRVDRVGIIELARPEKFNCLSRQVFKIIGEALHDFESDRNIRAVLIQSQGKHFCTGADLEQINGFGGNGEEAGINSALGHTVLSNFEKSHLPIVAAVQGLCLAGGLELILACDVVIAGKTARLGDQHANYGLIPGWGGTQRLPRIIGLRRAFDLFYSSRWIDAETAERWGLVNQIIADDQLHKEAMAYCKTLSNRNPKGIALMKRLARQGLDSTLADGLEMEVKAIPDLVASPEIQEGLAAFMERREPQF
ncbi:MAG: enoyl-CoA hydratase/isomerase family protein [Porticoccaceae bacterium]